jgi:hypothetical protein
MLHPVLQAFLTANSNRYPDLKITQEEDHLVCKYTDVDGLTYRSEGVILNGDAYPFFYCDDDGGGVSEPDPLAALARACALMADDGEDEMGDAPAEPGTFGAIVWTRAISGRLAEMERITNDLLNERLRLNPTTITDLPLFARDGVPIDADDCDPHGPSVQCHACAAEE